MCRAVPQQEGDPFAAAGGFFDLQTVGVEGAEDFLFLRTEDAGEDEGGAGAEGGADLRGGGAEDFAEDIGHDQRIAARWAPLEEVASHDGNTTAVVAPDVGAGGGEGAGIVVEGFNAGGAELFGGDGQNSGAGADIEGGPTGIKPGRFGAEEPQAGGGGGVFAGAESHGAGNAQQDAGLGLSGGPASVGVDDGEIGGELERAARGVGALGDGRGIDALDLAAKVMLQTAEHGIRRVGFKADDFGAGASVDDETGAE